MQTKVSSPASDVVIGERINPSGRKKLQEELKVGNLEIVWKFTKVSRFLTLFTVKSPL
jgi:cobalamin-dependent methionine synthase I